MSQTNEKIFNPTFFKVWPIILTNEKIFDQTFFKSLSYKPKNRYKKKIMAKT